ncbi:hypothetical protein FQR65_LT01124 [Abscondita terminalis]|nr:hypothetical protein FQR65_LT01124 [Abscondita terminalis]
MKTVFVFLSLLGFGLALTQNPDGLTTNGQNENVYNRLDYYQFGFDTSDGISRDEQGSLKNVGSENELLAVRGKYSYFDSSSGNRIFISYTADENGFRPILSFSRSSVL